MPISRRLFLGAAALPWFAACTSPLPLGERGTKDAPRDKAAAVRFAECAEAHGLAAYRGITDVSVAYTGQWRPFVDKIQPDLVDIGYRHTSEERLIPARGIDAQSYTGTSGHKQVFWQRSGREAGDGPGRIAVWRNGIPSTDSATLEASALAAEAYGLFLLGPLWLVDRNLPMQSAGTERVDGRLCDVVDVWLQPGLGQVETDRIAVCIDRNDDVMRRVRFTLEGTAPTRGAVAEVDTYDHQRRDGVLWPMRSYERVVHPLHLPAHDWHITGLDVNRGFAVQDLAGPAFTGSAAAPAAPV